MNRAQITQCVKEFARLGGKYFKDENPLALVKKFIIFRNFPADWQDIMSDAFPQDKRIAKQIVALHSIHRDKLPKLDAVQWFYVLNALEYQHGVEADTALITVHKRPRQHSVKHYQDFISDVKSISSTLQPHRDMLFFLQMASAESARNILWEADVMDKLGVDYQVMQQQIMPKLNAGRETDRAAKLRELTAILSFARVDTSILDLELLEKIGIVRSSTAVETAITTRKTVFIERLEKAMKERDSLWDTIDYTKLGHAYEDGITEKLAWKPANIQLMTKAALSDAWKAMLDAVGIIKNAQMDHIDKHRQLITKVEALSKERSSLICTARQSEIYGSGKGEVIEWEVPSVRAMTYGQAIETLAKINTHIVHLQASQIQSM